jgi:hypothetical protein
MFHRIYCGLTLVNIPLLWQNAWDKQLKRRKCLLVHGFRDFSPQSPFLFAFRPVVSKGARWRKAAHLMMVRKQGQKEDGTRDEQTLPGHTPNDLLPPPGAHLLKFPPFTTQQYHQLETQPSYLNLWGTFKNQSWGWIIYSQNLICWTLKPQTSDCG